MADHWIFTNGGRDVIQGVLRNLHDGASALKRIAVSLEHLAGNEPSGWWYVEWKEAGFLLRVKADTADEAVNKAIDLRGVAKDDPALMRDYAIWAKAVPLTKTQVANLWDRG